MINENSSVIPPAASKTNTYVSPMDCVVLCEFVQMLWDAFLRSGVGRFCLSLDLLLLCLLLLKLQLA